MKFIYKIIVWCFFCNSFSNCAAQNVYSSQAYIGINAGTFLVTGDLKLDSGSTFDLNGLLMCDGNLENYSSGISNSSSGAVIFQGIQIQHVKGSPFHFYNMAILNSAGIVLDTDQYVSNFLQFVEGNIKTGENTLHYGFGMFPFGASVLSYVDGNLEVDVQNYCSIRFDIGDSFGYAPVEMQVAYGTTGGSIKGNSIYGIGSSENSPIAFASGIDIGNRLRRHWNFSVNGLTNSIYELQFFYDPIQATGIETNYKLRRYNSGWTDVPLTFVNTGVQSTSGLSQLGQFVLGDPLSLGVSTHPYSSTVCGNSNAYFSSNSYSLPTPAFQWQVNDGTGFVNVSDNSIYSGTHSPTLMVQNSPANFSNYQFRCVFSNINGQVFSNAGYIFVIPSPTVSISSTVSQICLGDSLQPILSFSGPGPYYYSLSNGTDSYSGMSNVTSLPLMVKPTTAGQHVYLLSASNIYGCSSNPSSLSLNTQLCSSELMVKAFIEGYYRGNSLMSSVLYNLNLSNDPDATDTLRVELYPTDNPSSVAYQAQTILKNNGDAVFTFPYTINVKDYYLKIYSRNTLSAYSSIPVSFNRNQLQYNFTTSNSQSYGNILKNLSDGNFALFSGDLSTSRDGIISLVDLSQVGQSAQSFSTGYVSADLNGDGIIESSDFSLLENNLDVFCIHP